VRAQVAPCAFFAAMTSDEQTVGDLIQRMQTHVIQRRIRCKNFFVDWDPLRCGRVTRSFFARGMINIGVHLTDAEVELLADHFTEYGPQVVPPQTVSYSALCARVDEAFADDELQETMRSTRLSPSKGSSIMRTFVAESIEDEERTMHIIHRVAALCKDRGVSLKLVFYDIDHSLLPSPSMLSSRRSGKITRAQFQRLWPFKKEMSPADLDLICDRYSTEDGDVHYMVLHNDVTEVLDGFEPHVPSSPLHLRPDDTQWSFDTTPILKRVTAKVVEKRMRLKEVFYDFDPLRKGFCLPSQLKTCLTILNLSRELSKHDFDALCHMFVESNGLFNYKAFCDAVDSAFMTSGLEKMPLAVSEMPDAGTTSPARWNPMRLNREKEKMINGAHSRIRTVIRQKRILLKPAFEDFDRCRKGYVTCNQFSRIMGSMGIHLDKNSFSALYANYCDQGNHREFNWWKFLKVVDPPSKDVEKAMLEMTSPHIAFKPHPYFDVRGKVMPRALSLPNL